jgi:hypothetical protein
MALHARHRLTGELMSSVRGLLLKIDDGGIYALEAEPDARRLLGHRVTVEGTSMGLDRIGVEWIGQVGSSTVAVAGVQ